MKNVILTGLFWIGCVIAVLHALSFFVAIVETVLDSVGIWSTYTFYVTGPPGAGFAIIGSAAIGWLHKYHEKKRYVWLWILMALFGIFVVLLDFHML